MYQMLPQNYKMAKKYSEWPQSMSNGQKIDQHFPFQSPPKFSQIGIFGINNMPSGNPGVKREPTAASCNYAPELSKASKKIFLL
jgi:hypothetical protein